MNRNEHRARLVQHLAVVRLQPTIETPRFGVPSSCVRGVRSEPRLERAKGCIGLVYRELLHQQKRLVGFAPLARALRVSEHLR